MNTYDYCRCYYARNNPKATDIYGAKLDARLIAIQFANGDPSTGIPEVVITPVEGGRYDLDNYWGAIYSHPLSGGYNYDFAVQLSNNQWAGANHCVNNNPYDPMMVYEMSEADFFNHLRDQLPPTPNAPFNEMFYCAVCEMGWDPQP